MLDTKGPEIRTGYLKTRDPIEILANQKLKIVTDYQIEGDATKIACSYKSLPKTVSVGSTIFIADGSLTCEVCEIGDVSSLIFNIFLFYLICLFVHDYVMFFKFMISGFRDSYLQELM